MNTTTLTHEAARALLTSLETQHGASVLAALLGAALDREVAAAKAEEPDVCFEPGWVVAADGWLAEFAETPAFWACVSEETQSALGF